MNRRHFLGALTVSMAGSNFLARHAVAEEPTLLGEDDPMAMALGYVHDASTVDPAVRPAGNICDNCQLYQATDERLGGCSIFPGKQVAAEGWCKAWAGRPE